MRDSNERGSKANVVGNGSLFEAVLVPTRSVEGERHVVADSA